MKRDQKMDLLEKMQLLGKGSETSFDTDEVKIRSLRLTQVESYV